MTTIDGELGATWTGDATHFRVFSSLATGIEVCLFDDQGGDHFLGMPVRPIREHADVTYDLIIVASLEKPGQQLAQLMAHGIPRDKLFPLRREPEPRRSRSAGERARGSNGRQSE